MVGLLGGIGANRHPRLMKRIAIGSAGSTFLLAAIAAGTYGWGLRASATYLVVPLPAPMGSFAFSAEVNRLTVLLLLWVALIGLIVSRYAYTYLAGEVREGHFHRWLSLTLGSFLLVVVSGNIWCFLLFWCLAGLGLHRLLVFYRQRPAAVLAGRKEFLLNRIADACLFLALVLVVGTLHTSQWAQLYSALAGIRGALPEPLQLASGLLVLSAVLKSAQFPFHGWLIQVMEAPTPVSALLHAGLIYSGAFLLLRMVPLISRVAWTGDALALTGLVSVATASLMMMSATTIKGSLAYSTCGQVGFMLLECGLGLYGLALLHMISHAVYKAHAFLASGSIVDTFRAPTPPTVAHPVTAAKTLGSLLLAALIVVATERLWGLPSFEQGRLVVMGIVLVAAISQLLMHPLLTGARAGRGFVVVLLLLAGSISFAYVGLDALFGQLFNRLWVSAPQPGGMVQDALMVLIALVFMGLRVVPQAAPRLLYRPFWLAIYVHLYNDLYLDLMFTTWVRRSRLGRMVTRPQPVRGDHLPEGIWS